MIKHKLALSSLIAVNLCALAYPLALHRFYFEQKNAAFFIIVFNILCVLLSYYVKSHIILLTGAVLIYERLTVHNRVQKYNYFLEGQL